MFAILRCFAAFALSAMAWSACALAPETIHDLALGDNDAKAKAIGIAAASGDISSLPLLQSLLDGEVQTVGDAQILLVKGDTATDLVTGKTVTPPLFESIYALGQAQTVSRLRETVALL